jgi:xylulokinase
MAAERGPARCVVYPLAGHGERFPFAVPEAEGFTVGEPEDEVERYRATLEGVAFVERLGYERLAALGASAEPPVALSGGGSTSPVWNRIRATVLGTPVVEKATAGTALGACILAAAGTLHADLEAAAGAMAVEGGLVEPDDGEQDALEDSYGRFAAALAERGWLERDGSASAGARPGPSGA